MTPWYPTGALQPDEAAAAYGARQGSRVVVLDGKPGQLYDGIGAGSLVFSPNGQRLAYVAQVGKQQVVVVDGQASKPYKGIAVGSLVFSADSQHVAYAANDEGVLDGQAGNRKKPGSRSFSPDSQRPYAAAVDEANRWWWSMAVRVRHITASRWACWPSVQTVGTWRMAPQREGSWCWTIRG